MLLFVFHFAAGPSVRDNKGNFYSVSPSVVYHLFLNPVDGVSVLWVVFVHRGPNLGVDPAVHLQKGSLQKKSEISISP